MAGWRVWYTSIMFFTMVTHKVSCKTTVLDMAPNAVDDRYKACHEKMQNKILAKDGILQEELNTNSEFDSAWNMTRPCSPVFPGVLQEHVKAFQAFGNDDRFSKKFNEAVKTKGGNINIYTDFQWKSLHFLLVDAMRILNNGSQCQTVYSGVFKDFNAVKGDNVRFGEFFSANPTRSAAQEGCVDDGGTLFEIKTCSVVDLTMHACSPEHTVMLLSPMEKFEVQDVTTGKSDCDREIVLVSSGFYSNHDCYLFPTMPTTPVPTTAPTHSTSATTATSAKGSSTQLVKPQRLVLLTTLFHFCFLLFTYL